MSSSVRALLPLAALLGLGAAFARPIDRPHQENAPGAARELTAGEREELRRKVAAAATFEQVRLLLGPPHRVARQVLFHRSREQWVYGPPYDFRLEFVRPRGQKAQLLSVHSLRPE